MPPEPVSLDGATPDDVARDALLHMMDIATVDDVITAEERRQVESFRKHMGLSKRQAQRYWRVARQSRPVPRTHDERVALMSMLARVAYADGRLVESERRMLIALGQEFELSGLRLGELLGKAEAEAEHRAVHHRRWFVGLGASAVVGLGVLGVAAFGNDGDEMAVFKPLHAELKNAVALVETRYVLERGRGEQREERSLVSSGSGFFVSAEGHLVTNKHVLEPWKFPGRTADLLEDGFAIQNGSVDVRVWREGTLLPRRKADPGASSSSLAGSVTVLGAGNDVMQQFVARGADGAVVQRTRHARNNSDVALLMVNVATPVPFLELGDDLGPRPLDPVMVIGYPRGRDLGEDVARSSPSLGRIRTVGSTIHITASIVVGNSGGPLVNTEGKVIGLVTRTAGAATLGCCIRTPHIRTLLGQ